MHYLLPMLSPSRTILRAVLFAVALLITLAGGPARAAGARTHVVGDGQMLWMLVQDPAEGKFQLFLLRRAHRPDDWLRLDRFTGRVRAHAASTGSDDRDL